MVRCESCDELIGHLHLQEVEVCDYVLSFKFSNETYDVHFL